MAGRAKLDANVPHSVEEAIKFLDFVLTIEGKEMRFGHYINGVQEFLKHLLEQQQANHGSRTHNGRIKDTSVAVS